MPDERPLERIPRYVDDGAGMVVRLPGDTEAYWFTGDRFVPMDEAGRPLLDHPGVDLGLTLQPVSRPGNETP